MSNSSKVLVINAGSSSFKYQLLNMADESQICSGLVERIGEPKGKLVYKRYLQNGQKEEIVREQHFTNHTEGMSQVVDLICDPEKGVIKNKAEVVAVGHRVLLGGPTLTENLVTAEVKEIIRSYIPLGPLHNPANLAGIEVVEKLFPGTPNVAVFDTGFHATMPDYAYTYAIPKHLAEKYQLRRYGFHGTSHRFVSREAALFLGKKPEETNLITCHLGNGCSMAAVENGRCVDTSMGLTPLEGLVMGTRSGDLDPAILPFLMGQEKLSATQMDHMLNRESGLKGLTGTNDMRDIEDAMQAGDKQATFAFNLFAYRIVKYIGAYAAVLGRVDALVFTGGIGENSPVLRNLVCSKLGIFGVSLDDAKNQPRSPHSRAIHGSASRTAVLVVPTNEELEIARCTLEIVGR